MQHAVFGRSAEVARVWADGANKVRERVFRSGAHAFFVCGAYAWEWRSAYAVWRRHRADRIAAFGMAGGRRVCR
ncbi:hypothetical protein WS68_13315 [Burkholderia sp. TSV86]|nr:hypothetical protein WS68_13315 [Burkholderia sp. TSV86]